MAKKIKKYEFRSAVRNQYPWEQWLDGSIWVLTHGEDFETDPVKFRTTIYQAARRHNKVVRTAVDDNEVVLQVTGELNPTSA
jgi:hypothetical protein